MTTEERLRHDLEIARRNLEDHPRDASAAEAWQTRAARLYEVTGRHIPPPPELRGEVRPDAFAADAERHREEFDRIDQRTAGGLTTEAAWSSSDSPRIDAPLSSAPHRRTTASEEWTGLHLGGDLAEAARAQARRRRGFLGVALSAEARAQLEARRAQLRTSLDRTRADAVRLEGALEKLRVQLVDTERDEEKHRRRLGWDAIEGECAGFVADSDVEKVALITARRAAITTALADGGSALARVGQHAVKIERELAEIEAKLAACAYEDARIVLDRAACAAAVDLVARIRPALDQLSVARAALVDAPREVNELDLAADLGGIVAATLRAIERRS